MSYQVLARKYRPQTFADVAGQQGVVQTLVRALETGRVAHAFLFTGSRGVGKTTLARILARCLVCEKGISATPCGTCTLCVGVAQGSLTDVVEIDGASNNSVEQVRDLQEVARYLPQLARFKIFIIDEVHMLSVSAFNALLKILEEPPPHVKFIFATTEPHKIPVTILSRCQRYDFKRLPQVTIVERLRTVLAHESMRVSEAGLEVIARAAEGGMRDALSLTDQVLSFAGGGAVGTDEPIAVDDVVNALGIIDRRAIVELTEAAIAKEAPRALRVIENAYARGHDLRQLLSALAEELRHLAVAQATGSVRGFADLADEELARLDARAQTIDPRDIVRLLGMALDALDPLARSEDPRLHVELVALKMCGRAPLGDALHISEALVRLDALVKGKPVPPLLGRDVDALSAVGIAQRAVAAPPAAAAAAPAAAALPQAAPPPAVRPEPRPPAPVARSTPPPHDAPRPAAAQQPTPRAPSQPPVQAAFEPDSEDPPPVASVQPDESGPPSVPSGEPVGAGDDDVDEAHGLPLVGVDPRLIAFCDRVAQAARPLSMHLDHARIARITERTVEMFFPRELHEKAIAPVVDQPILKTATTAIFGAGMALVVVKPPAELDGIGPSLSVARETALAEAKRALEAHARSHPVVEKAVALFGGQVRAVRPRGRAPA